MKKNKVYFWIGIALIVGLLAFIITMVIKGLKAKGGNIPAAGNDNNVTDYPNPYGGGVRPNPTPEPVAPGNDPYKVVAKGDKGNEVKAIQSLYNKLLASMPGDCQFEANYQNYMDTVNWKIRCTAMRSVGSLAVDGNFGPKTESAIKAILNGATSASINQINAVWVDWQELA